MEPNEKLKFDWTRLLTTAGIVLVTALVVGGTTWYVMDKSAKEVKKANDESIAALQKQINKKDTSDTPKTVDPLAGWKTYTDAAFGFSLKYPTNIVIADDTNIKTANTISVKAEKLNDISENMPLGLNRATAIQDKSAIAKGDPTTMVNGGSKSAFKLLSIDGALGKSSIVASLLDVCNKSLRRTAYIYRNDYRIVVSYNYSLSDLVSGNPTYFVATSECSEKIWKDRNGEAFVADLMSGKTDQKTQDWYNAFESTIKTLTFN